VGLAHPGRHNGGDWFANEVCLGPAIGLSEEVVNKREVTFVVDSNNGLVGDVEDFSYGLRIFLHASTLARALYQDMAFE
jgi:hypothetical protein